MGVWAHRAAVSGVGKGVWFSGDFGADLGADTGLVELLLLVKEGSFFVPGALLVHALPLPLVQAAGEGARTASHGAGRHEGGEKLRELFGTSEED